MSERSFSKKSFISIINLARKKGYSISAMCEARRLKKKQQPVLILRHDIDLSLETALDLAKLEKKLKVRSTYFVLLYNNYYNPLSPDGRRIIREISVLGHEIGIHWDSRDYQENKEHKFRRDLEILSEIAGEEITSGSQHEPTSSPLMPAPSFLKIEAYRDFKNFVYVSDSSMKWRKNTPWELLTIKQKIQFLAHPFWWMTRGKTINEKFTNLNEHLANKNNKKLTYEVKKINYSLKIRKKSDKYFGYINKRYNPNE